MAERKMFATRVDGEMSIPELLEKANNFMDRNRSPCDGKHGIVKNVSARVDYSFP